MSCTRSSAVSAGSRTTRRRPDADRTASTCSAPNCAQQVPVLDYDDSRLRVAQQPVKLAASRVQPGPNLGHDLGNRQEINHARYQCS